MKNAYENFPLTLRPQNRQTKTCTSKSPMFRLKARRSALYQRVFYEFMEREGNSRNISKHVIYSSKPSYLGTRSKKVDLFSLNRQRWNNGDIFFIVVVHLPAHLKTSLTPTVFKLGPSYLLYTVQTWKL